jgi:hypothetical protein
MKIKALNFTLENGELSIKGQELDASSPQKLENDLEQEARVVLVVRNNELERIAEFKDLVVDRGRKHPAVELSRLLLRSGKYPGKALALRTDYTVAARLKGSIKNLLLKMEKNDEINLYLIGASEEVFDELHQDSNEVSPPTTQSRAALGDDFWSFIAPPPEPIATQLAEKFVGGSTHALRVRTLIYLATQVNRTVLILGETGTGKEVVARAIHDHDQRPNKGKFVPVNCSAIPDNLFESELFGYVKGAFSDARGDRAGLWQFAEAGTLFLDEIGDLTPLNQVKVLRALQERTIRQVGSDKEKDVGSVRVIAATNRDVHSMVESGRFREDLYYRLIQFFIRTPSLRDHPDDIPILARHFWKEIAERRSGNLALDTLDALKTYCWPGNARQLRLVLMNLNSFFPRIAELQVKHLKFVLNYIGAVYLERGFGSEEEISLNTIRSLRHLRRVEEVLRMFSVKLHPLVEQEGTDERAVHSAQAWTEFRLTELEELCAQPSLFGKGTIFLAVHQLLGRMKYFNELLKNEHGEALVFWRKEAAKEFRGVCSKLQTEIQKLLNKA